MSEISQEAICFLNDELYKRRVKDWGHEIKKHTKKINQNDMQIFSLCGIAIAMAADPLLSRDLKFAS